MADAPSPPGLATGFRAAGRGVKTVFATPEVGKTYLQLIAVLFALAAVLNIAGIWALLHFIPIDGSESWWVLVGLWLLRIGGLIVVFLASPVLALFVSNTLFPLLGERVFIAGIRAIDPVRADELAALEGMPLRTSIPQNLIRMALFLGLSLMCFALSLVPVVGSIAAPALQIYFTARAVGWELLDPYFEKYGTKFDAQHDFVRTHRKPLVGFALPFSLVMSIPLVGPLVFGVAQAAIGTLVLDVLEEKG